MNYPYRIIRSDRRTLSLQITHDGEIVVRAPRRMSDTEIGKYVEQNKAWLAAHYRPKAPVTPFSEEEVAALKDRARAAFVPRVEELAQQMGIRYDGVTVRMQLTKWGSCSSKKHINLNALLVLCPSWVADYVMVHELAHCRELNHSARFWAIVEMYAPRFREAKAWLAAEGTDLIRRIPK